jgi:hypothetical protein
MTMNLTDEQRFVVLLSIFELGGAATKADTLDNIQAKGYYRLDDRDLGWKHNRNEQVWRNELAFSRKRLEVAGLIDGSIFDNWQLTEKGRNCLDQLAWSVTSSSDLHKLTSAARAAAQQFSCAKNLQQQLRMPYDEV